MIKWTTDDVLRHEAAVRAGIRTAAQSARGAGVATVAAIGATVVGVNWMTVAGIAGAGAVTVAWAGVDAYLSIIEGGVPQAYVAAAEAGAQ